MSNSNTKVVKSACRMCHGVCQVLVHLEEDRVVKITGDKDSLTSRGYLCSKGAASPELLYHPERVTTPLRRAGKRGENKWEPISWDEAYDEIAEKLGKIKKESGPEYFGIVQGTGRPYTGFTQRFANAFGSPNNTGVAHICYAPRIAASYITTGKNIPVCDLYGFGGENPECIVIWGCNITHAGASDGMCGGTVQRAIKSAKKVIVIDPRKIDPAKNADYWLQIRPGTDGALALAMLHVILSENLFDKNFVENYTVGFDELVEHVKTFTPEWAESITRIPVADIREVARVYAGAKVSCIQWGNALDMSMCNFQTARAIMILMAITGHLDAPGGDVFWVPPEGVRLKSIFAYPPFAGNMFLPLQKTRLGVDGIRFSPKLNPLRLKIEDTLLKLINSIKERFYPFVEKKIASTPFGISYSQINQLRGPKYPMCMITHAPSFWQSIASGDPYRMRAVWIMGSNPLVTITDPLTVQKALEKLEYTVVSDFFMTPTAQYADLFLPASTWLERNDVVNLHKNWCVLAQQKVAQVGDTKDDREVMIQVARRLGMNAAFPWKDYDEVLDWQLENTGLSFEEFCDKGILTGNMSYRKYEKEGFLTKSGKFEIYSQSLEKQGVSPLPVFREPPVSPVSTPELAKQYPLTLIGGARIRYFFHGEFRNIDSLRKRNPDPLVEIHPETAGELSIKDGDWVTIETPHGKIQMKAKLFDGLSKDVVCAQHAWWFPEDDAPEYGWKKSNINMLFGDMEYDPDTGSESLKSGLCKISKS